jgi:hypothetical protein
MCGVPCALEREPAGTREREHARIHRIDKTLDIPHPKASFGLALDKRLQTVLEFECRQKRQTNSLIAMKGHGKNNA